MRKTYFNSGLFLFVICITALLSCSQDAPIHKDAESEKAKYIPAAEVGVKDGGVQVIEINTPKGKFKVWTKRIGNNPKVKLLLLNGGPGCTHEYFECFESFLPQEGIEFIYYDQLGCGHSDNPNDTTMWDLARYVEEVEQVRAALNLTPDNFYLLGHSWGGILALEYALKYQDKMHALIISNMMCSCPDYGKYADEVLGPKMKPQVLAEINRIEAAKDFSNPLYMQLLKPNFYAEHICRIPIEEWPEPMVRSLDQTNQSLYVTMQGPSEFGIAGNLEKWDRKADLPKLKIPVLTIGATEDTMDPKHMEWMSTQVQNGSFLLCPKGSHMCFYDDQQTYFDGLIEFLKKDF
jgi:proline iminopeptidase